MNYQKNQKTYGTRPVIIVHLIMLIISGSGQEKFKILNLVIRETVGTMRIVAFFCAGWWYLGPSTQAKSVCMCLCITNFLSFLMDLQLWKGLYQIVEGSLPIRITKLLLQMVMKQLWSWQIGWE